MRHPLDAIQDFAQQFQVFLGAAHGFFQSLEQFLFTLVAFALGQLLVKNDAFFQCSSGCPQSALECVGVLIAEAFRRKPMSNETLEIREFAVFDLVYRAVAFGTCQRNLVARRRGRRQLRVRERVVGGLSLDPRAAGTITPKKEGQPAPVHAVAVSSDGYALRFNLDALVEPSTRAGRRYARPSAEAEIVGVARLAGAETIIAATAEARGILCKAEEINFLSGPGKGVLLIKLGEDDRVLGFVASSSDRDLLTVETSRGAEQTISTAKYEVTGRGGKGRELLQRGQFTRVIWPTPEAPAPLAS